MKPRWIYELSQIVQPGESISGYKDEFENIAHELEGDVGRRKVRTVLSRYFLKEKGNPRGRKVENTLILQITKELSLEEVRPLLLTNLLCRAPILQLMSDEIATLYGNKEGINYNNLRRKMIEKFGERDISGRSVRNFLYTLSHFDIVEETSDSWKWKDQDRLDNLQTALALFLYSQEYIESDQIMLNDVENFMTQYYELRNMEELAKDYNNELWKYSKMLNRSQIIFQDRDVERIIDVLR